MKANTITKDKKWWDSFLHISLGLNSLPGSCARRGGRRLVDLIGDFSWTKGVTSRGHFCPQEVLFLGEFSWAFFG